MHATNYDFGLLFPSQVEEQWPQLRELLAPAIPHCGGDFELDDILTEVQAGHWFVAVLREEGQLCLAVVAAAVHHPRRTALYVYCVGGRRLDVAAQHYWAVVANMARALGADVVRGAVRPAMERYYRRIAPTAERVYAVLERSL